MTETNIPKRKPTVLIADDDQSMRDILSSILKNDYNIITVDNGTDAVEKVQTEEINIALLDIKMPGLNGLEALKKIKEINEQIEVIMNTVITDIPTAVKAIKDGAYNYINKNFQYDEVKNLVKSALEKQSTDKEIMCLRTEIQQLTEREFIIGNSQKMLSIHEIMKRAAPLPATVLIMGESGTGKELAAREIHRISHLSDKPLVTINLAAIPNELIESILFGHEKGSFTGAHRKRYGKFELADGGTLFLDEIGELKYELQSKLLRFLQEGEVERIGSIHPVHVNVRLIAATNNDLANAVKEGRFRNDLFYRLNVVPITLPPLRERTEDLPELSSLFIKRYCNKFQKPMIGFAQKALDVLYNYSWPGNIRELENLVERLVATCNNTEITEHDLPIEFHINKIQKGTSSKDGDDVLKQATDIFERNFIIRTLEDNNWHRGKTSDLLGIHRKTLEYKIKKLNIE